MRAIVPLLLLATLAAGCVPQAGAPVGQGVAARPPTGGGHPLEPGVPHSLTAAEIAAVKSGVRYELADPASARFGAMRAARTSDGVIVVCGWVNARNSRGAYVGELPYVGVIDHANPRHLAFKALMSANSARDVWATVQVCRESGITI